MNAPSCSSCARRRPAAGSLSRCSRSCCSRCCCTGSACRRPRVDSATSSSTFVFRWGALFGALFAALLGALSMTGEFRHGTIRPTLLVDAARGARPRRQGRGGGRRWARRSGSWRAAVDARRRVRWRCRRAASTSASRPATSRCLPSARSSRVRCGRRSASASARSSARRSPPIAGLCVWLLFVENLLVAFVPAVGRFGPGAAGGALAGIDADDAARPGRGRRGPRGVRGGRARARVGSRSLRRDVD